MNAPEMIERSDVERALREFTGYQADAVQDAGLMVIIDAYAAGMAQTLNHSNDKVVKAYLHTLTVLAEHLLDTGGKMVLTAKPAPVSAPQRTSVTSAGSHRPGTYLNDDGTITCRVCHLPKQPDDYARDSKARTGRKSQCKVCTAETRSDKKRAA